MAEPIKSIFDLPQYQHLRDKFDKRRSRFRRYWKYYKSDYPQTFGQFNSAPGQYIQQMLANAIKPLFTPLARAVNIDVALVPGKWALLPETPDAQRQALARLFKASRWPTEGDLWVRYGTALGETGLRIVDDRMAKRVMAQPVAPWTYVYEPGSPFDTTPALAIFIRIEKEKNERGQWVDVEYAEVMTPQTISTYRNGQPQAGGGRPQTYTNALEMVPLVVALHDCGDGQPESPSTTPSPPWTRSTPRPPTWPKSSSATPNPSGRSLAPRPATWKKTANPSGSSRRGPASRLSWPRSILTACCTSSRKSSRK
jgi:hypothetical protein